MTTLRIPTAPVFRPLLEPARSKGSFGGRGSGKSNFFGELLVEECLRVPGTLAVCIREVQKSLMQSSKRMIETKIQQLGVGSSFQILHDRVIIPGGGLIIFVGMHARWGVSTIASGSRTSSSADSTRVAGAPQSTEVRQGLSPRKIEKY
jgi:hypothetical protein